MAEVHEDPYPSRFAMEAAVELEIHSALGCVQTQTIGKVIQRAIDKALKFERGINIAEAEDLDRALSAAENL